jgi:photosystem II stability/assembly factor-like uncharacterized protein
MVKQPARTGFNPVPAVWPLIICLALIGGLAGACARRPTPPASAAQAAWQSAEAGLRVHAALTALATDPGEPGRTFAAAAGVPGLWSSNDPEGGWQPVTGAIAEQPVYTLLAGPSDAPALWAGTAGGLYTRPAPGADWQRVPGLPDEPIYALAQDSAGALLAGGSGPFIYRQAPGADWQPLAPLPAPGFGLPITLTAGPAIPADGEPEVAILALATGAGGSLLAGTDGSGLFRSGDGGQSWTVVPEIGTTFVAALCVNGQTGLARTRRGLFRSGDGGRTWQPTAEALPGRVDALACHAAGNGTIIGTSLGDLYRSADGGMAWQRWGNGTGRPGLFFNLQIPQPGVVPGTAANAPAARRPWLAGTETGLYLSFDEGLSWQPSEAGPGVASANALAASPDDSAIYLGNADGVYVSTDAGGTWTPRRDGLPAPAILSLAVARSNPQRLYAGLDGAGVYRSDDGGLHWQPTGWARQSVPGLLLDPRDPDHLFMRVAFERVYESRDGGKHWAARWDGLGLQTQIIALAADPVDPARLYAGGTEGFFTSQDGTATWQSAGPELAGQTVFTIVPGQEDSRQLYAGATQGLYRSSDQGTHWARAGAGLADLSVTSLIFPPGRPGLAYAGTRDHGLWMSTDSGQTWQAVPLGGGPLTVQALLADPAAGWLLVAADRGVYRVAMPAGKR